MNPSLTWPIIPRPAGPWTGVTWMAALHWRWQGEGTLTCVHVRPIGHVEDTPLPTPVDSVLADTKTMASITKTFTSTEGRACCPECEGLCVLNITATGDAQGYVASVQAGHPWHCPACAKSTASPRHPALTAHALMAKEYALTLVLAKKAGDV